MSAAAVKSVDDVVVGVTPHDVNVGDIGLGLAQGNLQQYTACRLDLKRSCQLVGCI